MENNNVLAITNDNAISTIVASNLSDYGYNTSKLERTEEGETLLTLKDEEGGDIVVPVKLTEQASASVDGYAALMDFEKLSGLYKAYYVYRMKDVASDNGFKSVGEFCAKNFGIKAGTANQYYKIAEKCLNCDGDKPEWKYEWLKGSYISNINQCMSIINQCESMQEFKEKFIDTGKLSLRAVQARFKEQMQALTGKQGKKQEKKQEKQEQASAKGEESMLSKWASVEEFLLEKISMSEALTSALDYINICFKAITEQEQAKQEQAKQAMQEVKQEQEKQEQEQEQKDVIDGEAREYFNNVKQEQEKQEKKQEKKRK